MELLGFIILYPLLLIYSFIIPLMVLLVKFSTEVLKFTRKKSLSDFDACIFSRGFVLASAILIAGIVLVEAYGL